MKNDALLEVKDLNIKFKGLKEKEYIHAINGVDLILNKGESVGIVGESGSGKTQFVLSILNLLPQNAVAEGEIIFNDKNILSMPLEEINKIRGKDISMIFQDPMTSLNPYLKISTQMREVLLSKKLVKTEKEADNKCIEMLKTVGITDAERRYYSYPHHFSGGMRQRVLIAMSILTNPKLLIADEPTTALDVTIQSQILKLLHDLKNNLNISIVMITHDLGVVANLCDKIAIFYGGKIVEYGSKEEIFYSPKHPYTKLLLKSIPKLTQERDKKLTIIEGSPPVFAEKPKLCVFKDRCPEKIAKCEEECPALKAFKNEERKVACLRVELEQNG